MRGNGKARTGLKACSLLAGLLLCGAAARGEVVIQRWAVGERASHPGTIEIVDAGDGAAVIQIDLSALADGSPKVHQARLLASREPISGADDEAMVAVEIYPLTQPFEAGKKPALAKAPLKLMGPWYDAFDATAAVAAGKKACQLYVKAFPKWLKDTTELEVAYEGKLPGGLPAAVKGLEARHRAGQTFITWREIDDPFGDKPATLAELRKTREEMDSKRRVRYRIYRHVKPIDSRSLAEAELLGEAGPLCGYNVRGVSVNELIYQHQIKAMEDSLFARKLARGPFGGYHAGMPAMGEVVVRRLAVEDGKPLPGGTGLYVHHPAEAGQAYYAVVTAVDGTANTKDLAATAKPVAEQVGGGEPVFQGLESLKVFYDYPGQRRRYVQWCGPGLASLPNQYYNWGVYVPPAAEGEEPLALGMFFHDGPGMYLKPRWPHPKDMILVAPHDQVPQAACSALGAPDPQPTFAHGYHECLGTLRAFGEGAVRDYTGRRIDAFVDWAFKQFRIDKARMSCHGSGAYGGSSAIAYALRHPQRFALVVAGAFDACPRSVEPLVSINQRRYRTHLPALEAVWGKKDWDLKTAEGKSIWEDRDLVAFVARNPKLHLPFMSLGTGSNHATWPQETALLKALMAARQPFRTDFTWGGQAPHFGPLYVRRDRVMLAAWPGEEAMKKSNLFSSPHWQQAVMGYWGGGHAMINMDVGWTVDDVVDTPEKLEVSGSASGEVTLRNVQAFKLKPGEKVRWEVRTGRQGQDHSGTAAADENGLVTLGGFRGRLIVTRAAAEPTQTEEPKKEGANK